MQRSRARVIAIVLVLFAAWSVVVLAISVGSGDGHGSVYWTTIGAIAAFAAAALWFALRLYRSHLSKR